jgi:hypothetical protein
VITVEDWAEIRRLHRAEKVPIKEIVRRLGVSRNTVRSALASDHPPRYERAARGSLVDAVEVEVRKLLRDFPRMPSTVIAERIGWEHSITILKDRVKAIRPEYAGIDPADRIVHVPGAATQCDLWFPEPRIPVGHAQAAMLPVLAMTLTYSRFVSAVMLPSRQAGDLLAGMWQLIAALGAVSKTLVWDLESAIGKGGRLSAPAAMFAGTLGTRIRLLPPRDPESKTRVAYCTSSGCCGGGSCLGWSVLLGWSADGRSWWWVVGVDPVVEVFAFIVIPLAGDNSGLAPLLDGLVLDAEGLSGFGEGAQALYYSCGSC